MHKLISLGVLVSSLFVFGCASHELTAVKGPDGLAWVAVSCKDSAKNCWKTAGDFCPAGYDMADEVQSTSHGFLFFGHHMKDEMLIRCKLPEGVQPSEVSSIAP